MKFSCIKFNLTKTATLYWISNSRLWKIVLLLETFQSWPGKLTKGVLFHQDNAPSCTQVWWLQWLLCMTVALNRLITLLILVWHHSDYFLFPNMKKITLGWVAVGLYDWWWGHKICSWGLFWGSGWELLYQGNPSTATPINGRSVWTAGEIYMLKNKPNFDQIGLLDHRQLMNFSAHPCIILSMTFSFVREFENRCIVLSSLNNWNGFSGGIMFLGCPSVRLSVRPSGSYDKVLSRYSTKVDLCVSIFAQHACTRIVRVMNN